MKNELKFNFFLQSELLRQYARQVEDLLELLGKVSNDGVGHGMAQFTLLTHYTEEDVERALSTLCVEGELFSGRKKLKTREKCHANDLVAAE